jgi:hypothetical protein
VYIVLRNFKCGGNIYTIKFMKFNLNYETKTVVIIVAITKTKKENYLGEPSSILY